MMSDVHLGQIDLNLLRVFDALAEERSVTRAGHRLGLTQSAISHALRRLREAFDDPLFIRSSDGMRPTRRASEIAPNLREALAHLQLAIGASQFDPQSTDRRFNIAAGPYVTTVILPPLVERVHWSAPGAEIVLKPLGSDLDDQLRTGAVDLAIGAFTQLSDQLERENLFEERGVWTVRAGHPHANTPLSLKSLAEISHVVLSLLPAGEDADGGRLRRSTLMDGGRDIDQTLARAGLKRHVAARVNDVYGALKVVSQTDLMMLAPRRLALMHAEQLGLVLLDPPNPARDVTIESVWSREAATDPSIVWLRNVLRDATQGFNTGPDA